MLFSSEHTWNHPETFHPRYGNSICCLTQREGDPPSFIDRDSDSHKLSYLTEREGDPHQFVVLLKGKVIHQR